ncbi:MAG TPA: molybdenum cofactor guanylyltransferase [Clostridiales bacterium]|nr:molybdenum cofactor guanylyltransferase [Clostridiales bacterium]
MKELGSAVILAGGRSSRMGFDKQMLKMQNKRIIDLLIPMLRTRFDDIMVSSRMPELYKLGEVRVIQDVFPDMGPLGGIHSALINAESRSVFTVACDMPFLELPYIDYMMSLLEGGEYDACVTLRKDRIEPFHAFYCRSGLPVLEEDLSQGKGSIFYYTRKIRTLMIREDDAAPFLPGWRAFTNLNTREEYERFRADGA